MSATVTKTASATTTGGRASARQLCVAGLLVTFGGMVASAANSQPAPVTVVVAGGVYRVAATFVTPQPSAVAHAVLTDYEGIPRFMPDVQSSRIVERRATSVLVEQEAVARVLFFSKRIRLMLDVSAESGRIRFRDESGQSFTRYEGVWTLREQDGHTVITYELMARPAFEVPEFLLTRLLKRDADRMIASLQAEIGSRARTAASPR
jgi:ribosome-associated toxin RatA of RatAB toxin-antitoxin module